VDTYNSKYDLITILGPTASGKTTLAVALAKRLDTEIISADSRQVYRDMNIGTGKDLAEYELNGVKIPYHLIDICNAGDKYNLFEFQHDFQQVYNTIRSNGKTPILCGGTGLYIESVLKGYQLLAVPENKELRHKLENKPINELANILSTYKSMHNVSDFDSAKRTIRAIEIAEYSKYNTPKTQDFKPINSLIIGIDVEREIRRKRISQRLKSRLDEGLIFEVKSILEKGVSPDNLIYYGLEYKFVTQFLIGEMSYNDMQTQLETAIHQFAKRQMTWFRGMERRGFKINWIDSELTIEEKIGKIRMLL
jgi:tRNA dimethylallyltransferase